MKRKRHENDAEEPTDTCISDSSVPLDHFTAISANQASDSSLRYSTRVTTQGMVGDSKELADLIVGRIWEATGYRFTLVDSEYRMTCINR